MKYVPLVKVDDARLSALQLVAAHFPSTHAPAAQLEGDVHALPSWQAGHEPPQSMSLSVPFLTASVHEGAAHVPLTHTPEAQSVPARQATPAAHGEHASPPQSTSVSFPFFTWSPQVAGRQVPPVPQTSDAQSASTVQPPPSPHGAQSGPPQSMPVSVPPTSC
jgi:hypothetical protein